MTEFYVYVPQPDPLHPTEDAFRPATPEDVSEDLVQRCTTAVVNLWNEDTPGVRQMVEEEVRVALEVAFGAEVVA